MIKCISNEGRYTSAYGDKVVNFFNGQCFIAASPLLGSTGSQGEVWTLLGNKLISSGLVDRVILIPAAIGASPIQRWQEGGELNGMLLTVIDDVKLKYRISHILWHQGESDFVNATSGEEYRRMFLSLIDSVRHKGVTAPIFPSVTTKCRKEDPWTLENPIAMTQKALPDKALNIYAGVNTDFMLDSMDRSDGCHMNKSGQEKTANAYVEVLRPTVGTRHFLAQVYYRLQAVFQRTW